MSINEDINNPIEQDNSEPGLRETFFPYFKQWKWFLLSVIVFLALGYLYGKLSTPLYKIETDLLIKDNKKNVGGSNDLLQDLDLFSSDKIIDNEIQILKSKTIVERAVQTLKLQTSYYATKGVRKRELYSNIPLKVERINTTSQESDNSEILSIGLVNN